MASDRGVDRDHGRGIVGRRMLVEALVRAMVIEMADEPVEDGAGVSLVVDQYSVGALRADAANESLGVTVRLWGTGRDFDHVDAFGDEDGIEGIGELGVSITDQEAKRGDSIAQIHHQAAVGWAVTPRR
jgi:hypothetical protein